MRSTSSFSNYILRIASITLAVALATLLITISLVNGFQHLISDKVYTIWGNYRILPTTMANESVEEYFGNSRNKTLEKELQELDIAYDIFSSVFALSQTKNGVEGVMLKSFDAEGRWDEFIINRFISPLDTNDYSVYVSRSYARRYGLGQGDYIFIHVLNTKQNNATPYTRIRKMSIAGIYHTGIGEYDQKIIHCHTNVLRKLGYTGIGGYELFLPTDLDAETHQQLNNTFFKLPLEWTSLPIERIIPDLFDWIAYAKSTEWVFLVIMSLLIFVNLVIGFMLFVVDRSKMIGVFLALGYHKMMIYKIIFLSGLLWILLGMMIGIVLASLFLLAQNTFGWIQLNEEVHYLTHAVVRIDFFEWFIVLISILIICMLSLILPARVANSYRPTQILRFS